MGWVLAYYVLTPVYTPWFYYSTRLVGGPGLGLLDWWSLCFGLPTILLVWLGLWAGAVFKGWCWLGFMWAVAVLWVWLPTARDVVEFLAGEARLGRLPRGELERLMLLARAAGEFEGLFFGDGDGVGCLGYYVVWWGRTYRVFVVVAYESSQPIIEVLDVEEWVSVAKAKRLAKSHTRPALEWR